LTQSISSKSQDIVAQSKILLDETMRQLKVDLHKLRYGQELLEEQHDKHNDNVFYQQALSTMLCEYSIKARVSLGMQQFQSILAEA